jgi:APA family basic amino acid/polyamine antiporter
VFSGELVSVFRIKSIDELISASEAPAVRLRRTLGLGSLVALGIGSVIGSGIFTMTGTAAAGLKFEFRSVLKAPVLDLLMHGKDALGTVGRPGAGPAISLSFVLVAIACGFAALCYAELASMIPVSGSAYTYAYATMGEIFAWIIGWDLILEYAVANMAIAVGFGAYFNDLLENAFGFHLPSALCNPVFIEGKATGAVFNLPSFLLMMILSWILVRGARESAGANNTMVIVKVIAILVFVIGAARAIHTDNWHPFMPNGFQGVLTGSAIVFFTYVGFDAVSTAAEECRQPQRDMPRGILLTLLACALLYASVALVLTGIAHWDSLNNDAPVANALKALGFNRIRFIVTIGALLGMISSLLVGQFGQARIWFAMSRDRLLPPLFSRVHPVYETPHLSTWVAGVLVGIPAGIWDIGTFGDLTNIGTLFAFIVVSIGVIILRRTQPDRKRSFRVPWVPFLPGLSIFFCLVLMLSLPLETWIRFVAWLIIGLAIYFLYGHKRTSEAGPRPAMP